VSWIGEHRTSSDQRRGHHPDRQGDGEVERRDHREDSIGPQHDAAFFDGRGARALLAEAVGPLHLVAIMADEVDCLLDLTYRLRARLTDLDQAGDGEIPLAFL